MCEPAPPAGPPIALDDSARLFYPSNQGFIVHAAIAAAPSAAAFNRAAGPGAGAGTAHEQGRLAEAEALYAEILAERPDHFDALQMLGVLKLAKGQPAEALRLVSAAMALRKPSPQILLNHGMILHALERSEEALASFDAALKQKSKFAEAHNNRGAVLAALGRDEEALDCFKKALALKPDYADAHYNRGSSLRVLGQHDEALTSLDRALALTPIMSRRTTTAARCWRRSSACPKRSQATSRRWRSGPDFTEARKNRGRVLIGLGRADDAVENFSAALASSIRAMSRPGICAASILLDLGRNDEAAADLAQALALKPDHAEARFAACFVELPVVYTHESEIARRRAGL